MLSHASALTLLKRHGQEHLLRFWEELDGTQRENLLGEIAGIDFDLIARLYRDLVPHPAPTVSIPPPLSMPLTHGEGRGSAIGRGRGEEISPLRGKSWENLGIAERAAMSNAGMRLLREGKAAAFVVAGGQGTRLGHDGPKGALDIGLPSGKSLFQLQGERLLRLSRTCGKPVPWYVMTSRENHAATTAFFEKSGYFGLERDAVSFFPQGEMPAVDGAGKILLADRTHVALGPNGNGGCFPALRDGGALEDMRARGVEWVFIYGVDNALVRVCDPRFLGFAAASGLPAAAKAVAKAGPGERVGVFCLNGGRPAVLEYSEIPAELRDARDEGGNLLYGSANVAIHLFRRDYLEAQGGSPLPYHAAHKKIPYVDALGKIVNPAEPNAWKFELFMFDHFARGPGLAVLDVNRAEEFAPVKNPSSAGVDSPATARKLILDLHRNWALAAGFSESELAGAEVEVSPLASYAGEDLRRESFRREAGSLRA